jgi:hypothetical protein
VSEPALPCLAAADLAAQLTDLRTAARDLLDPDLAVNPGAALLRPGREFWYDFDPRVGFGLPLPDLARRARSDDCQLNVAGMEIFHYPVEDVRNKQNPSTATETDGRGRLASSRREPRWMPTSTSPPCSVCYLSSSRTRRFHRAPSSRPSCSWIRYWRSNSPGTWASHCPSGDLTGRSTSQTRGGAGGTGSGRPH